MNISITGMDQDSVAEPGFYAGNWGSGLALFRIR